MLKLKVLDELNKPYSIFTDYVEGSAIDQFVNVMKQPDVVQGALMPDVHAGYVLPIGGVVATKGTIYPAFVGYDIGCGVSTVKIGLSKDDLETRAQEIRDIIRDVVPVGFASHHHAYNADLLARRVGAVPDTIVDLVDSHLTQVATLGGGNHFIEVGYSERTDPDGSGVWISIHSGSRGLGHKVASRFMEASGGEGCNPIDVNSKLGQDYITAMNYCLRWALFNREKMMRNICNRLDVEFMEETMVNRNHNHAEEKEGLWIHRKGATHAEEGMLGVIPSNMRDGVFIVKGKGNADSMSSSSHGAGRVMSRSKAKKQISLEDFVASMGDRKLAGFSVEENFIDEAPAAYKPIDEVMTNQQELIEVVNHIIPVVNVKG